MKDLSTKIKRHVLICSKARLYKHEMEKKEEASENLAKSKTEIGWGHQIRSYVLQPYQLGKRFKKQS